MAVVSELVSKFSFIGSLSPQKEFNANLKVSVGLLAGAAAGLSAAAGGFFAWTTSVLGALDPMIQLGRTTGVAAEQIQALGYVASVNGSSASALEASISGLSKSIGDASRGLGRGKKAFEDLGISLVDSTGKVKTADVVLNDLRQKFSELGTSMEEQQSIAASLGIDRTLVQMLNLSDDAMGGLVDKATKLGVVTQDQADGAAAFNDSLTTLKFGLSGIQNAVAVGFAPAMQGLTDRFVGFLETNHELIKDGLIWLGDVLSSTMGLIERMAPIVMIAAGAFIAWQLATGGLVAIMGVLLSPVVLITAAIVALLLIVDDLIVAFNGGQSVIRDFFMEFLGFDIVPIMQGIVGAFMWMIDTVSGLLDPWFASIGGLFSAVINVFKGNFTGALDDLKMSFRAFGDFVLGIVSGLLPDWVLQYLGSDEGPSAGFTPNDAMAIGGNVTNSSTSSNIEQQVQINVSSSDPRQAGAAVNDALQEQLRTAKTQVNRGGR